LGSGTRTQGAEAAPQSFPDPESEGRRPLVGGTIGKFQKELATSKKLFEFSSGTCHAGGIDRNGEAKNLGFSVAVARPFGKLRTGSEFPNPS
jgi:hypothetical protein